MPLQLPLIWNCSKPDGRALHQSIVTLEIAADGRPESNSVSNLDHTRNQSRMYRLRIAARARPGPFPKADRCGPRGVPHMKGFYPFVRRQNQDSSIDSICATCYQTIASTDRATEQGSTSQELGSAEQVHVCNLNGEFNHQLEHSIIGAQY
jgi:hypothetical protein